MTYTDVTFTSEGVPCSAWHFRADSDRLAGPVKRVGERLAAVSGRTDYQWEFHVIASETPNAFCLPGGKVAFYEGIMPVCANEAGVAVVMSHEISHALARHGGERMSQTSLTAGIGKAVDFASKKKAAESHDTIMKAYGAAAQGCLHDLHDLAHNPAEKDYIRRDAAAAAAFIEEAVRIAAAAVEHRCQRCNTPVSADEYARSQQAFQRPFCDRCFDEVFLERRNFETQVEINKTIEARDGTVVQSEGERRIADWLTAHGLAYRYDAKFRIIAEFQIRPDFYLPELDVYLEYWGLDTPQYKMSMYKKQTLYQQEGKRLISVYPQDLPALDRLLVAKLRHYGFVP